MIGGTAWDHFRNKFGERYNLVELGEQNLNGIIVTDEEVGFFESLGRGDLLKDRKFTYGTLSYDEPDKRHLMGGQLAIIRSILMGLLFR